MKVKVWNQDCWSAQRLFNIRQILKASIKCTVSVKCDSKNIFRYANFYLMYKHPETPTNIRTCVSWSTVVQYASSETKFTKRGGIGYSSWKIRCLYAIPILATKKKTGRVMPGHWSIRSELLPALFLCKFFSPKTVWVFFSQNFH